MNNLIVENIVALANRTDCVYVATADEAKVPHIATAGQLRYDSETDAFALAEWFCPQTVANLRENIRISVVIWNAAEDKGYQLQGHLADIHNTLILDGYEVSQSRQDIPQVRKELMIKIDKISEFCHAAHSDENLVDKPKGVAL